jgi:hypothetical protein
MSDLLTIHQKQALFAVTLAKLILWATDNGYEITMGRGFESAEANKADAGNPKSLHLIRLAHDLCAFKDGVYLRDTVDYKPLGDWWQAQGKDFAWGGTFTKSDGNHFSFKHGGMQ